LAEKWQKKEGGVQECLLSALIKCTSGLNAYFWFETGGLSSYSQLHLTQSEGL